MWIYQEQIMPEKSNLILQEIPASVDIEVVIDDFRKALISS